MTLAECLATCESSHVVKSRVRTSVSLPDGRTVSISAPGSVDDLADAMEFLYTSHDVTVRIHNVDGSRQTIQKTGPMLRSVKVLDNQVLDDSI